MKFYSVKKLIDGGRISSEYMDKTLIAVPYQYLGKGEIQASFGGQHMIIKKGDKPLCWRAFDDKFGRGTVYRLMYFEWVPLIPQKYEYR
jgi:hypothetical protein